MMISHYDLTSFQVLRIVCETRIGPLDFVSSIREALVNHYGNETVGEYNNIQYHSKDFWGLKQINSGPLIITMIYDFDQKIHIKFSKCWYIYQLKFYKSQPIKVI